MKVTTENTVAANATLAPEDLQAMNRTLIRYRTTLSIIKTQVDQGKISQKTYRAMARSLRKHLGIKSTSIFAETP